jgi:hypothetical protein
VIQDLEGATSEPSRRRHVAVLSAAVAAISIVLLYALIVPAPRTHTPPPLAASPVSSPTDGSVGEVMFSSASTSWVRSDQVAQLRDDMTSTVCVSAVGSNPPIHLIVFDRNGQRIAAYTGGNTGRFISLPQAYVGSGWLTVPCDRSDVFAPRINRAR